MKSKLTAASQGAGMGVLGGLIFFLSEYLLTQIHAEISSRTYAFFLALYVVGGGVGGAVFAPLVTSFWNERRLSALKERAANLLPGLFVFAALFLYGFYYINEKLTPAVGVFAPLSLVANLIYVGFCFLAFRMLLGSAGAAGSGLRLFVTLAAVPLAGVVALNFRLFLWHAPRTFTGEVFLGVFVLGGVALAGAALGRFFSKSRLGYLLSPVVAGLLVLGVAFSGGPATTSYARHYAVPLKPQTLEKAPNIIWIVLDTARRDQLSIYNDTEELTPNLDALARDAVVFNRAISSAPWTIPSHASMFTGMFPSKHAAHRGVPGGMFTNPLSKENLTIAEILAERGYDTACIAANVAGLSRNFGFAQGFRYYFDGRPVVYSLFWGKLLGEMPERFRSKVLKENEICLSSEINGIVFDWLQRREAERPFFLFINYMEPHDGIEHVPEPYDSMFGFSWEEHDRVFEGFDQGKVVRFEQEVTPEQFDMFRRMVARRVYFMDHQIGRLFERLKTEGLYDDAFIIVTSDHGELNGEHNSFGHNTDLYNEVIWVPLIVKYPGNSKTGFSDRTVQNVDIMPELLHHLGIEIPEGVQGQPFDQITHEIIAELFEQKKAQALLYPERYYRDLRAIYATVNGDSLKYIWASNGVLELYDMSSDPREQHNLAEARPEVIEILDRRLDAWLKSFTPVRSTNGKMKYTKEVQDRLRSLGYIK